MGCVVVDGLSTAETTLVTVSQIQAALRDSYHLSLSEDTMTESVRKYHILVAARHQDVARVRDVSHECQDAILTIDGIQPEKGHETLYVVRELRQQRILCAEALLSRTYAELRKVLHRAKVLTQQVDMPVRGWVSDKQEAFVVNIAAEFPEVPHRYCENHFLRDVAQGMLERDSQAKVQMRKKIRGLRTLEKDVLAAVDAPSQVMASLSHDPRMYAVQIVRDACATVRGILNDNHGGPFKPPGWRMANALPAVLHSLERNLKHPAPPISGPLRRLAALLQRGLSIYEQEKLHIEEYIDDMKQVFETLNPDNRTLATRHTPFQAITVQLAQTNDAINISMSKMMQSFEKGLFMASDELDRDIPRDNLELALFHSDT